MVINGSCQCGNIEYQIEDNIKANTDVLLPAVS